MTAPGRPEEQSLGELVGELGEDLSQLLRKEVELAKVEAREEATRLTKAATFGIVAGVAALLALVVLSMALAWWIDAELARPVAFALVGAGWVVVALVAAATARASVRKVRPMPETVDAIKSAVTGDRTGEATHTVPARSDILSPTHQLSDTRRQNDTRSPNKETAS